MRHSGRAGFKRQAKKAPAYGRLSFKGPTKTVYYKCWLVKIKSVLGDNSQGRAQDSYGPEVSIRFNLTADTGILPKKFSGTYFRVGQPGRPSQLTIKSRLNED